MEFYNSTSITINLNSQILKCSNNSIESVIKSTTRISSEEWKIKRNGLKNASILIAVDYTLILTLVIGVHSMDKKQLAMFLTTNLNMKSLQEFSTTVVSLLQCAKTRHQKESIWKKRIKKQGGYLSQHIETILNKQHTLRICEDQMLLISLRYLIFGK